MIQRQPVTMHLDMSVVIAGFCRQQHPACWKVLMEPAPFINHIATMQCRAIRQAVRMHGKMHTCATCTRLQSTYVNNNMHIFKQLRWSSTSSASLSERAQFYFFTYFYFLLRWRRFHNIMPTKQRLIKNKIRHIIVSSKIVNGLMWVGNK